MTLRKTPSNLPPPVAREYPTAENLAQSTETRRPRANLVLPKPRVEQIPELRVRSCRGFTLVEVLVALAVLAIALAGVMRAMAQAIDTTAALREHEIALWVAQNRLNQHQMNQDWPSVDTTDGDADMGDRKLYWREQVATTPEPKIRRIEITVRQTADSKDTVARLVGYLRNAATQP